MSTRPAAMEPVIFTPQTIYCGDCLEILKHFPSESVDLVYIDPPFNSNRNYEVFWGDRQEKRAFDDRYGDAMAYIEYMRPRVIQLHRVLKKTGSFYYHCDWHASHYIKVMLDEIFGFNYFQAEVVWKRTHAKGDSKRRFPRVNDYILLYTKGDLYTFNRVVAGHSPEYVEKYYNKRDKEGRRYQLTSISSPQPRPNMMYEYKGFPCPPTGWRYSRETMEELDKQGRIYLPEDKSKRPRLIRYLDEQTGTLVTDNWGDIPPISAHAKERLGYPTQKPLALLERIIKASSNEGDLVLDAFCGCGTTLVAAQQLGRRWVGIDISPTSSRVMGERLETVCGMKPLPIIEDLDVMRREEGKGFYRYSNLPRSREELRALPGFEFENWAVLELGEVLMHQGIGAFAQTNRSKVGDLGLDGKLYLVDNVSLINKEKETLFGEKQPYLPIQVKNKDKASRPDMDSFAHALRRDKRQAGFFIAWDFSRDAYKEIERLQRLPHDSKEPSAHIIPVKVDELLDESFKLELLLLQGGQ